MLFITNTMDVAQILQGPRYKVSSIVLRNCFPFGSVILFLGMHHYTPTNYCYATNISEIGL